MKKVWKDSCVPRGLWLCISVAGFKFTCFHWKIGWIVDDSCIVYDSLFCECSLALPKDGQPDLCQCSIGPGVCRTTLKVNSFCCSFSHRWPGVGRTQREVLGRGSVTRIPCLLGLPSTHTLGANVASRVCCAVWQRSDELTRSLGVHWLCFACLAGEAQSTAQKPNYKLPCCKPHSCLSGTFG